MITADNTVTNLFTSFTLQLHSVTPCICLRTTHPCNPPHCVLWVNLYFFTMCIYKHCFLPMLLVSAMKCCTKMPCPLLHNHYCCSLPSPVCLPHLLICTCLISSPVACPPSSVLCWCFFSLYFFLFLWYVAFLCDSYVLYLFLAYVKPHFWLVFQIYLLVFYWLPFWIVQIWLHYCFV